MMWLVLALTAAFVSGTAVVVEKKTLYKEHAMEFAAVFSILFFIFSLVLIPKVDFSLVSYQFLLIYMASITVTIAFLFEAKGIRHLQVSSAAPLFNISPILVVILSYLFLGESISNKNLLGIALIAVGAYLLESTHLSSHFLEPIRKIFTHKYTLFIVVSTVFWSITVIIHKFILSSISVYTYLFFMQFFVMINFIILIHIFHDGFAGIRHGFINAWKWASVMAALSLAGRFLYLSSLSLFKASLVYPIFKTNALFSTLIGGKLFHEHKLVMKMIVSIIMVIGVFLIAS